MTPVNLSFMKRETFGASMLQKLEEARRGQDARVSEAKRGTMAEDFPGDASFGPLDEDGYETSPLSESEQRRMALQNLLDAWDESLGEGVDADILATTAIFAALSDMVEAYGEEAVAEMTAGFADRVRQGEFTLNRTLN